MFDVEKDWLFARRKDPSEPGIQKVRFWAQKLGIPIHTFAAIHVGGTNGKGSVSAMLEAIYRHSGYKTGLFTSPHLVSANERIRISGQLISDEQLLNYTRFFMHKASWDLSFFEIMTLMAFLHFKECNVEMGIFEVGIGGRLDATNVLNPDAAIITSIGLDHMDVLGETLESIAREKAGIIKRGRPLILGPVPRVAEQEIQQRAIELCAPLWRVQDSFTTLEKCPTPCLQGSYQRWNAAAAVLTCQCLTNTYPLINGVLDEALNRVQWPGRWQCIALSKGRKLILDGSHNAEGAECLKENLSQLVSSSEKPIVITGILGEHRAKALIPVIAHYADKIILTCPHESRALLPEQLEALLAKTNYKGLVEKNSHWETLFDNALEGILPPEKTAVVTGSLYLVGKALDSLQQQGLIAPLWL